MSDKHKIGFLIPCTSKKRDSWKNMEDSYLMKITIDSFLKTYDDEHSYIFYIGYDSDDRIHSKPNEQNKIITLLEEYNNVRVEYISFVNIEKGFLTKMWNVLFKRAYDDKCEYFYQCGDDISFRTSGWVNDSINTLKKNKNIGLTGPINNNSTILTQAFVSRKHMEIFGWFFPESIRNWHCDDWYNVVYKPRHFFPLVKHLSVNVGGLPRYDISNMNSNIILVNKYKRMCNSHKLVIRDYIARHY